VIVNARHPQHVKSLIVFDPALAVKIVNRTFIIIYRRLHRNQNNSGGVLTSIISSQRSAISGLHLPESERTVDSLQLDNQAKLIDDACLTSLNNVIESFISDREKTIRLF